MYVYTRRLGSSSALRLLLLVVVVVLPPLAAGSRLCLVFACVGNCYLLLDVSCLVYRYVDIEPYNSGRKCKNGLVSIFKTYSSGP